MKGIEAAEAKPPNATEILEGQVARMSAQLKGLLSSAEDRVARVQAAADRLGGERPPAAGTDRSPVDRRGPLTELGGAFGRLQDGIHEADSLIAKLTSLVENDLDSEVRRIEAFA